MNFILKNGATNSEILRGITDYKEKINTMDDKTKCSPVVCLAEVELTFL